MSIRDAKLPKNKVTFWKLPISYYARPCYFYLPLLATNAGYPKIPCFWGFGQGAARGPQAWPRARDWDIALRYDSR